jgi:hypothetical protein
MVFAVIFGLFVAAMVVLCVLIMRWAIKRDIAGRRTQGRGVSQGDDGLSP